MPEEPQPRAGTQIILPPIAPLPPEVVERIAAGEVIERPASVARELIENALDAGASEIRIELRDGGLRMVRVSDNGYGILADELELACRPHTTSKLRSLGELEALRTLGFRGEALASIAAVAELEVVSAADESGLATELLLRPDALPARRAAARPRGTTVVVRDLFACVPARRALLRGPHREAARANGVVRAYALVHADVSFTLVHDGMLVFRTNGSGLTDAFVAVYGADAAHSVLPLSAQAGDAAIKGYICDRAFSQPGRDHVVVAVNGRPVANRALVHAAEAGYRPLLRKGRHPILVVSVSLPPEQLDTNIHPAKAEVLVRDETMIGGRLRDAIHQALGSAPASFGSSGPRAAAIHVAQPIQLRLPVVPVRHRPRRGHRSPARDWAYQTIGDPPPVSECPELAAMGQLDDTLILATAPDGSLYVIDQHRAHERILYERLRSEMLPSAEHHGGHVVHGYRKIEAPAQLLLDPILIELSPRQSALLSSRLDELASLGVDCQPFGGSTFLVRALPHPPGAGQQPSAFAAELARDAAEDSDDWLDHLRVSLACRSAIRRGQRLTPSEQASLLRSLRDVSAPAICPHGSPLLLRYSRELLARVFEW